MQYEIWVLRFVILHSVMIRTHCTVPESDDFFLILNIQLEFIHIYITISVYLKNKKQNISLM